MTYQMTDSATRDRTRRTSAKLASLSRRNARREKSARLFLAFAFLTDAPADFGGPIAI